MLWIEIVLPGSLLLAKFSLKLLVDRSPTFADCVIALLALPVDVIFISASLVAGHAIASSADPREGLSLFCICIVAAVVIVALSRRADGLFTKDMYWKSTAVAIVNFAVSVSALVYSVALVSAVHS